MLRLAIPDYRLPAAVVERDIENVTALGVEIATGTRVDDLEELRGQGYEAVLVSTGAPVSTRLGVPGEDLNGVLSGLAFLEAAKVGRAPGFQGKRTVVVGGGNVAMDAARTARRLGAREVTVAYRRGRGEMPAYPEEIEAAEQEGTAFSFQVAPVAVAGDGNGHVTGLRCVRTRLGEPDASGRRRPEPIPDSEHVIECETVIAAIGLSPDAAALAPDLSANGNGAVRPRSAPSRPLCPTSSPPATWCRARSTSRTRSGRGGGPRS